MSVLTRRAWLTAAGLAGAAFAARRASDAYAQTRSVRTRVNVYGSAAGDAALRRYTSVVGLMRRLPTSDPRQWDNFARVHLDYCPHGNWYFLPWHRAYLSALEAIGATLLGDSTFALPHWDWTLWRWIPWQFFDASNPLYEPSRALGASDSVCSRLGSTADCDGIYGPPMLEEVMNETRYQDFASSMPAGQDTLDAARWQRASGVQARLEYGAHNTTHNLVGGAMQTFLSPRDPLFFLHHANVDRMWYAWSRCGGRGETHPLWTQFVFPANFPSASGRSRTDVRVGPLADTLPLGYVYDDIGSLTWACRARALADGKADGKPQRTPLGRVQALVRVVPGQVSALVLPLAAPLATTATAGAPPPRTLLYLRGVSLPANTAQTVRVFLDRDGLTTDTAPTDPRYVTTFALFGHHAGAVTDLRIDLTRTVRTLAARGALPAAALRVQLLALGNAGTALGADAGFDVAAAEVIEERW